MPPNRFPIVRMVLLLLLLSLVLMLVLLPVSCYLRESHQYRVNNALAPAIARGDLQAVRRLLDEGADANYQNCQKGCKPHPLEVADRANSPEILRLVIERGMTPRVRDEDGDARLVYAVRSCAPATIRMLLDSGASPNSWYGVETAFEASAQNPRAAEIQSLLKAHGYDVNARLRNGDTALMRAIWFGAEKHIEWLLAHGAKVKLTNQAGDTALSLAQKERAKSDDKPAFDRIIALLTEAAKKE